MTLTNNRKYFRLIVEYKIKSLNCKRFKAFALKSLAFFVARTLDFLVARVLVFREVGL